MNDRKHKEEPVLQCTGIQHSLSTNGNKISILRGLNITLRPANICAVVGPSGCGKSTFLFLAGLLDQPEAGEIVLKGKSMTNASDRERTQARNDFIGFIFQFHFLLPEFNVTENIILPMLKQRILPLPKMKVQAQKLLAEVGLEDKADRLAHQLSGGEQQRVAIARALANSPSLILADEPTGNLDLKNSNRIFNILQRISREKGHAILLATHNVDLAQKCDYILHMQDGSFI